MRIVWQIQLWCVFCLWSLHGANTSRKNIVNRVNMKKKLSLICFFIAPANVRIDRTKNVPRCSNDADLLVFFRLFRYSSSETYFISSIFMYFVLCADVFLFICSLAPFSLSYHIVAHAFTNIYFCSLSRNLFSMSGLKLSFASWYESCDQIWTIDLLGSYQVTFNISYRDTVPFFHHNIFFFLYRVEISVYFNQVESNSTNYRIIFSQLLPSLTHTNQTYILLIYLLTMTNINRFITFMNSFILFNILIDNFTAFSSFFPSIFNDSSRIISKLLYRWNSANASQIYSH